MNDPQGDNNGLQTVVAALELIYTNVSWPSSAPALSTSLYEAGRSRADLWQFAGMVALEIEVERANFACDYDYNSGNQVKYKKKTEKISKIFRCGCWKEKINVSSSSSSRRCSSSGGGTAFQIPPRR